MKDCLKEPYIYFNKTHTIFILFFVNDFQIIYHKDNEIIAIKITDQIKTAYKLKDLGDTKWFLGIRILRNKPAKKLWLAHDTYIEKIAKKFKLNKGSASTPLPNLEFIKFNRSAVLSVIKEY
ncbi:hypothetical protein BOTCAL_1602g00020 [Botryotinia calthae]|uniref:Reverse transcriptase Ty1/copia-type domain-containing protein n=1 Tax=Botryotinia calthae TaxID=38488 RepID=A0A4Y8CB81_9HELO|nr:hypothetical protein BOTCAL_1602g00020 [Botryotinia calthae]